MARKISVAARVDEKLLEKIDEEAQELGLNRSEYIVHRLENNPKSMNRAELKSMIEELLEEMLPQHLEEEENYTPPREFFETGDEALDVADLVPPMLAGELNCLISAAHEAATEAAKEELATPFIVLLFEKLAHEVQLAWRSKVRYECAVDYREVLGKADQLQLSEILADVSNELGPNPRRDEFLSLFAELLEAKAESTFLQAREISFSFDREQWHTLDQLLELVNRSRGEGEQFADLSALLMFLLGEKLREEAHESLFGGYRYPTLAELGKSLQRMAVE